MNPYFIFWIGWLLAGVGVEVTALISKRRVGKGIKSIDTLSRFTQWLVRAHQGDAGVSHAVFLAAWGLLAVWFPLHILG